MDILDTTFPLKQHATYPEDVIFKHIEDNIDKYDHIDKTIVNFSIFPLMNSGVSYARIQQILDMIISKVENPIFIINYDKSDEYFNFGNSIVFTPEATYGRDNFFGIPRDPQITDDGTKYDRDILFSFRGANWTHPIRKKLVDMYPNECLGYSGWGCDNKDPQFKIDYINQLKRSIFSLCPRGYGRTSFRLYESMMMGSIPVIISDAWKPPLYDVLDWNEFSLYVDENDISRIPEILATLSDEVRIKMGERAKEVYYEYFSNENMYKCFDLVMGGI